MLDKTKNYKIDVSNLSTVERSALQEELFKMGYRWYICGKKITKGSEDFYLLHEDMDITCCDSGYANKTLFTPLTVSDILPQTIELPTITLRDWFAGQALFGLMAMYPLSDIQVAKRAFEYADAMMKERATHNTHSVPPSDSKTENVYGVVDTPKNAVPPVFYIGDKIRFKSTGRIEKISTISHGGRFINSVDVNDVEKL